MKHKKCKRVAIGQSLLTQFARMMVPSTGLAIVSGKRANDQEVGFLVCGSILEQD